MYFLSMTKNVEQLSKKSLHRITYNIIIYNTFSLKGRLLNYVVFMTFFINNKKCRTIIEKKFTSYDINILK